MKYVVLVFSLLSLSTLAQESQGIVIGTHLGVSYDVYYPNKDIDEFSPDMKTEGLSSLGYVSQYSLERKLMDRYHYGAKFNFGNVYGENEVEKCKSTFVEFSFMGRYIFVYRPELVNAYFSSSLGVVSFSADRELIIDGGAIPISNQSEKSFKWDVSLGLEKHLTHNILCYGELTFNEVRHDGFDGWDYGSNVDKYNLYAIGVKFILNK